MAKKAATVSWRTLTRQADKARNPRTASRLRKQAHELRRSVRKIAASRAVVPAATTTAVAAAKRAAQGWATRRANEIKKAAAEGGLAGLTASSTGNAPQGINREQTTAWTATDRGAPGHGEVVGGAISQMADRIAKLARKKGGTDAIQNELAALAASSKYEGCVETDRAATKRLIEVQEILAQRVVCGFIAEIDHAVRLHHGLPRDQTWMINSFLVTKIVDALNKAGYSARGMRDSNGRSTEMARGYDKDSL